MSVFLGLGCGSQHDVVLDDHADRAERQTVSRDRALTTNSRAHYDVRQGGRSAILRVRRRRAYENRAG